DLPAKGEPRHQSLPPTEELKVRAIPMHPWLEAADDVILGTALRTNTLRQLQEMDLRLDQGELGADGRPLAKLQIPDSKMKSRRASVKFLTPRSRAAIDRRRAFYTERGLITPNTYLFGKQDGTCYPETSFPYLKLWRAHRKKVGMPTSGPHS